MKRLALVVGVMGLILSAGAHAAAQSEASVTLLHGIPGVTVDLVVDGEIVVAGFEFGDVQDLTPLAGETLQNIEGRQAGGGDVLIGPIATYEVPAEGNNSVVVHLDADGQPTITAFTNQGGSDEQGRGVFTVRHAAAAPPVDVSIGDDVMLTSIGNGEGQDTVLPAGEITDAALTVGGEPIAPLPTLLLEANTQLIVYVGGDAAADNLAFYLQVASGGELESMPAPAGVAGPPAAGDDEAAEPEVQAEQAPIEAPQEAGDDGTPQPAMVNTGDGLPTDGGSSTNSALIALLAAVGMAALLGRLALTRHDRNR